MSSLPHTEDDAPEESLGRGEAIHMLVGGALRITPHVRVVSPGAQNSTDSFSKAQAEQRPKSPAMARSPCVWGKLSPTSTRGQQAEAPAQLPPPSPAHASHGCSAQAVALAQGERAAWGDTEPVRSSTLPGTYSLCLWCHWGLLWCHENTGSASDLSPSQDITVHLTPLS